MDTKYKISPCKAAFANQKLTGTYGIIQLNDTCYDTCNAYGNPVGCTKQCSDMIEDVNIKRGYTKCYPKRPLRPPIWQRPKHYFPDLLNKSGNINESLSRCFEMCSNDNLPNECKNNCITDKDAIIEMKEGYIGERRCINGDKTGANDVNEYSGQIKDMYKVEREYINDGSIYNNKIKEGYNKEKKNKKSMENPGYKDYEKAHPISFYIGFLSIAIILSIVIATFVRIIFYKK